MARAAQGDRQIVLAQGDITRVEVDAIVNAANSSLMGSGGVDGAIHRGGGPAILQECMKIRAQRGPLPAGQAVATTAGELPARYVIHTVGPVWRGGDHGEVEVLASCHTESIRVADSLALATVAFPAISTGAYGYPPEKAAPIALRAAHAALASAQHVRTVHFVLFDQELLRIFRAAHEKLTHA